VTINVSLTETPSYLRFPSGTYIAPAVGRKKETALYNSFLVQDF